MSTADSVSSNISSGISSIGDSIRSLPSSTTSAASSMGQSIGETARTAASGTTAATSSATSSIGSSLSSVSSSAPSSSNASFSSLFSSSSSTGQTESSFWNSSLLLGVIGLILFIFAAGNIYMYATTGKALFWEELFSGLSSVTGEIKTFFDNLMNSSEVGGKGVVEVSGETVKSAASIPDQIVKGNQDKKSSTTTKGAEEVDSDDEDQISKQPTQNSLQKKIDRPAATASQQQRPREIDYSGPEPTETNSKSTGGSSIGFCYIGEYNGNRSCASVNDSSNCMSGDIFDTKDKCMNPSA
jgi:hypothetical protein